MTPRQSRSQGQGSVKDRVVELRRVPARDLLPNPANWRRHPERQRAALRGILRQIGYADALLARQEGDRLRLIDGHLRQSLDPDQVVPVLVLDVDEAEADLLLTTLDPLGRPSHTRAGGLGRPTGPGGGLERRGEGPAGHRGPGSGAPGG